MDIHFPLSPYFDFPDPIFCPALCLCSSSLGSFYLVLCVIILGTYDTHIVVTGAGRSGVRWYIAHTFAPPLDCDTLGPF